MLNTTWALPSYTIDYDASLHATVISMPAAPIYALSASQGGTYDHPALAIIHLCFLDRHHLRPPLRLSLSSSIGTHSSEY